MDPSALLNFLQQEGAPHEDPIVMSFKAGKMTKSGTLVTADKRKGRLVLVHELDDGMLRLQWRQRPSETVEDSIIAVPGNLTAEVVPECTTGRVILIRSKSDPESKLFFWMQEADVDKDAHLLSELNKHLKTSLTGDGEEHETDFDPSKVQEQLFGPSNMSTQATSGTCDSSETKTEDTEMGDLHPSLSEAGSTALLEAFQRATESLQAPRRRMTLNAILNPGRVLQVLSSMWPTLPEQQQKELLQHLPESQQTWDDMREQLHSPPFAQCLARLTYALEQGQGAAIIQELGLEHPTNGSFGVAALLEALLGESNKNMDENE